MLCNIAQPSAGANALTQWQWFEIALQQLRGGSEEAANTAMFHENIKAALRKAAYDVTSDSDTCSGALRAGGTPCPRGRATKRHREEPWPPAARPKRRDDRTYSLKSPNDI